MRHLSALLVTLLAITFAVAVGGGCKKTSDEEATSPDDQPKKPKTPPPPKKGKTPEKHRAAHADCDASDTPAPKTTTFGPRMQIPPGPPCKTKADCKDEPNGRCSRGHCTYDGCTKDADCKGGGVCTCEQEGKRGYYCKPGDCSVDSDCGESGYCSPTWSTSCGGFFGVTGYYCHRPDDECTDDSECKKGEQQGYCAFDTEKKHWVCGFGHCVGSL